MNQNHRTGLARTQMQPNSPDCGPRNISMGCKIYKQLHSSRLGQSGSSMTCVVLEHCASRWFHNAVRWALAVLVCIWNVNILVWSCPPCHHRRLERRNQSTSHGEVHKTPCVLHLHCGFSYHIIFQHVQRWHDIVDCGMVIRWTSDERREYCKPRLNGIGYVTVRSMFDYLHEMLCEYVM